MGTVFKRFTAKNWFAMLGILIASLLLVACMMLIVDNITVITMSIQSKDSEEIWKSGLLLVIFSLLLLISYGVLEVLANWNAANVVTRLRAQVYEKINQFSVADLNSFSTESLITRTTNDMQNLHLSLLTAFRVVFVVPANIIWSITKILTADLTLTLSAGIWIVMLIIVMFTFLFLLVPKFKVLQKYTDALNLAGRENLTGLQIVRAFNAEDFQEAKFEKANKDFTKIQLFTSRIIAFLNPIITFVHNGLALTVLWVSSFVISKLTGKAATDAFAATNSFVMLASQVVIAFILLIMLIVVWPRGVVSARRIKEVLVHEVSLKDTDKPVEFVESERGTIEFKNVSFAYPGAAANAIENFSFRVNRGETLALIGSTGSGKTTAVSLMPRLHDVTEGEVYINGVNVKDVSQEQLHKVIGYVPQKKFLFKGTVRDNIAFSNPDMEMDDVIRAAKIAEADGFIMASDKGMGYSNPVAQGGTNYSGGQRQRLCIARAVAKNADILIFDDSFSALDYRTDRIVRDNIKKANDKVTRVIVAARIGTIMDADQILVLDKGHIVGKGTHKELLKSCPEYQEIALSQLSKEELGL